MGIGRRRFLGGMALVGAGAAVGVVVDRGWLSATEEEAPAPEAVVAGPDPDLIARYAEIWKDLREYFDYLDIPDATLEAYLRTLQAFDLDPKPKQARAQLLLSTDFFQSGADESRPLTFLALYDPYRTPCYSPFAAG
jgi:hypothetical protein